MLEEVLHIGITVSNIEKSIIFYRDVLGLKFVGELLMEGEETDLLFDEKDCKVRVAYLNGSDEIFAPPIELLEFLDRKTKSRVSDLSNLGISEICFKVRNIDVTYKKLLTYGVDFISTPQEFDFSKFGFGKSKAVYFRDPDGTILELIQPLM